MAKLSPVNQERLDVVHHLAGRLLTEGLACERLTLEVEVVEP
jgi:hypothetical protein